MINIENLKRSVTTLTISVIVIVSIGIPKSAFAQISADDITGSQSPAGSIWVDSLDVTKISQGWGDPHAGKSVQGQPITLGGVVYQHGIGTHAISSGLIALNGEATKFEAYVGVDAEKGTSKKSSVDFSVTVDGIKKFDSGVMRATDPPQFVSVDLTGAKTIDLDVGDAGDGNVDDHADWAGATLTLANPTAPGIAFIDPDAAYEAPARIKPMPDSPLPVIHYPTIVGSTPGRPFLFLIPATGKTPLIFRARHLPEGLTLDPNTGIITGSLIKTGTFKVTLSAKNSLGKTESVLTIVGGTHKLALTPPMGWNSWNVFAQNVDQGKVEDAAHVMIDQGLAKHGYEYVNIDDTWEAGRDANGNILANQKFPDMKALADSVHAMGLHIGIYSSPGPTTCGGYTASYQHEQQDANSYANWGFDYLKYDWCSYGGIAAGDNSLAIKQKPYQVMRAALDNTNRDIVFSLCQYGDGDVWKWGADPTVGGNCWRTTGDIRDNWGSMYGILEQQNGHEIYAGPGHWNDPDMLVLGSVGWGTEHPTHLHENEQLVHFSMWCMLSAPLLIGCDMTKLDTLTREILTNDEVIAIDQDQLGKPAHQVSKSPSGAEIWSRKLVNGAYAVALLNSSDSTQTISAPWKTLGITGAYNARDLWLHMDLGDQTSFVAEDVPPHGIVLIKLSPVK